MIWGYPYFGNIHIWHWKIRALFVCSFEIQDLFIPHGTLLFKKGFTLYNKVLVISSTTHFWRSHDSYRIDQEIQGSFTMWNETNPSSSSQQLNDAILGGGFKHFWSGLKPPTSMTCLFPVVPFAWTPQRHALARWKQTGKPCGNVSSGLVGVFVSIRWYDQHKTTMNVWNIADIYIYV